MTLILAAIYNCIPQPLVVLVFKCTATAAILIVIIGNTCAWDGLHTLPLIVPSTERTPFRCTIFKGRAIQC